MMDNITMLTGMPTAGPGLMGNMPGGNLTSLPPPNLPLPPASLAGPLPPVSLAPNMSLALPPTMPTPSAALPLPVPRMPPPG